MDETKILTYTGSSAAVRAPQSKLHQHLPTLNVGVSWANSILAAAGSLIVTPALLHSLGVRDYGIWLLTLSFVGQLRILDLGMSTGCMKFSASALASSDRTQLRRVFNTSATIFTVAGSLALAGTLVLMFALPRLYPAMLGDLQGVIAVLGVALALDFFFRPYAASLRARSLFFVYDGVEIVTYTIFKLGLVLYFSYLGMSLWWLCLLTLAETVARNMIVFFLSLKYCRWTSVPNLRDIDRAMLGKLFLFSGACFLMGVADLFRFQFQTGAIGYFMEDAPTAITIYGIGLRLIWLAAMSIGVIGAVMVPRFSELTDRGEHQEIRRLLQKYTLNTGILTGFALVSLGVFGETFLRLWIRKPWVDECYLIALIALPGYFVAMVQSPATGLLTGAGRLKWQTAMTLAEALVNVCLTLVLIKPFGLIGVCLAMAVPMLVFRVFVFPWVLRKELGISIRDYGRMHVTTAGVTVTYLVAILGFAFIPYDGILPFLVACIAATAIFCVIVALWVPEARQRGLRLYRQLVS